MSDTPTTPAPADQNAAPNANGNEPGKNGNEGAAPQQFDPSKLSDEQLSKVLEDQRLWNTPRIKELRDQAKKGKDYETAQAQKAQEEAVKKGEFDKVLGDKDATIKTLTEQINNNRIDASLGEVLRKAGVLNIAAGLKLIDRTKLAIAENGQVEGIDEAIKTFSTQYPELIKANSSAPDLGGGTNPGSDGRVPGTFKMSEIADTKFYQEHEAEIMQALRTGKIIDDRG